MNHDEAIDYLQSTIGSTFHAVHLHTTRQSFQLHWRKGARVTLVDGPPQFPDAPSLDHDRKRQHLVPATRPWLAGLGVTTSEGRVAKGMESKFRQINKFVEIVSALLNESGLAGAPHIEVVDLGCGKGYLTFALAEWLQRDPDRSVRVRGIEARPELVQLANRVAQDHRLPHLNFVAGVIADTPPGPADVIIALHACDTATDDAIAEGVLRSEARLIVVSPCCHKELRTQLRAPAALASALRHGIMAERQAEFITDALRAALLEWAGFETKIFEFISTEHTAKNLMLTAARRPDGPRHDPKDAERVRALAAFYGIRTQRLAGRLGFDLHSPAASTEGEPHA